MAWYDKNRLRMGTWRKPLKLAARAHTPEASLFKSSAAKHQAPWYRAAQQSARTAQRIARALSARRIAIPLLLGLGAAVWLFTRELNQPVIDPVTGTAQTTAELLSGYTWSTRATWALLGVLSLVLLRDAAYILRLRLLTLGQLRWRQCLDSILLWEFASALTPSVVGGSAVAILILNREGMPVGRSAAVVFVTALLDELFYILAVIGVGLGVWAAGGAFFPSSSTLTHWGSNSLPVLFGVGFGVIVLLTTLILMGVLVAPSGVSNAVQRLFRARILKRWAGAAAQWSADLVVASAEFRNSGWRFWAKAFGATSLAWLARFLTLNMVLLIFYSAVPHAAVLGRQLVMWVILLISPTPGSTGVAEILLPLFLGDLMELGYLALVAVIWRGVTYFPYLFAGALVLPGWLARTAKGTGRRRRSRGKKEVAA
ncbi:MAG: hypothetical protein RJA19_252 [Bacteroidota bacterium]|jgi:uncharacterized membrane protein YbhN (UPF0104 family)